MKTKNLIILSVWSAITIIFVVISVLGVVYTTKYWFKIGFTR